MKYTPETKMALELVCTLSNETPAPVSLVKADLGWDNNELSQAINEARGLGIRVIRERGCLYISLDTWPLAKREGNRYYEATYGTEESDAA